MTTSKAKGLRPSALPSDRAAAARSLVGGSGDAVPRVAGSLIQFRPYQQAIFLDRSTGIVLLHWSRQIGKSFTLGAWAVDRLLTRPGRLVTVLSNSRDNGAEFVKKCEETCQKLGQLIEIESNKDELDARTDLAEDVKYELMRFEIRITVNGQTGRIKVLAANPRTARGFSGDLILDEFAFHENSNAIWEAAEPILSSNPDFLCRIASTGNGKYNMFYRMVTGRDSEGQPLFTVSRVTRTDAWKQGVKIYDPNTRKPITPDQARAKALDKKAYDQNYECAFNDENAALLTHALIDAANDPLASVICDQYISPEAMVLLMRAQGDLFAGQDVGRHRDISVIDVGEKLGTQWIVRATIRLAQMRLPDQQKVVDVLFTLPKFRRIAIDMTGIGLGLVEYLQEKHGQHRVQGVNFASTVPVTEAIKSEGRKAQTVRVTEAMAVELLQVYEDRRIKHSTDMEMREDLRKPEKITSPGGRVSIAAVRDEAGHADHFWSKALMVEAGSSSFAPGEFHALTGASAPIRSQVGRAMASRRERSLVG